MLIIVGGVDLMAEGKPRRGHGRPRQAVLIIHDDPAIRESGCA